MKKRNEGIVTWTIDEKDAKRRLKQKQKMLKNLTDDELLELRYTLMDSYPGEMGKYDVPSPDVDLSKIDFSKETSFKFPLSDETIEYMAVAREVERRMIAAGWFWRRWRRPEEWRKWEDAQRRLGEKAMKRMASLLEMPEETE